MKKVFVLALCALLCLSTLTGCFCSHVWEPATCQSPERCTNCGRTHGSPRSCAEGEWEAYDLDLSTPALLYCTRCQYCDKIMSEKSETLTTLHNGSTFLLTPNQLLTRIKGEFSGSSTYNIQWGTNSDAATANVYKNGSIIGNYSFSYNGSFRDKNCQDEVGFSLIMGIAMNSSGCSEMLLAMILACDPTLDVSGATSVATSAINYSSTTKNGIKYAIAAYSGMYLISASVV